MDSRPDGSFERLMADTHTQVENLGVLEISGLSQTQPWRQTSSFCRSRQAMTCVAFENTASISTDSIGSVGSSGCVTRLTKKCGNHSG